MGKGALRDVPELVKTAFPGKKVWLIADENTYHAAGEKVFSALQAAAVPMRQAKIFPGIPKLHPNLAISQALAKEITADTVPVVVGSGVLNDLTKCASDIAKVPYCCVATAASVDGYTSYGGAMSVDGMKKNRSLPCPVCLVGGYRRFGSGDAGNVGIRLCRFIDQSSGRSGLAHCRDARH